VVIGADGNYLVIDGMHRITAVNLMLEDGRLDEGNNDHMVHMKKSSCKNNIRQQNM
jgi:hypothetical protein